MRCKVDVLWLQATVLHISMCIIKIMPGAEGRYDVTIGGGTNVDPSAQIIAEAGPIIIGGGCNIGAQVKIINRNSATLIIGSGNNFQPGCTVESRGIGGGNIFGANCFVGKKVTVSSGCIISAGCKVTDEQIINSGSAINC